MLLRIILKNFLSFDGEMQFDMFPNMKKTSLLEHVQQTKCQVPVLKMAAIYGANGAGKSNLMKAMRFLQGLVEKKTYLTLNEVGKYFFALKKNAGKQPMELTVEFIAQSDKPFIYSVEIAKSGIRYETLQISGLGMRENEPVFVRKKNEIVYYVTQLSNEVHNMIIGWMKKNPFASLMTINDDMPVLMDEHIGIAKQWFTNELTIIGLHSFVPALIDIFKNRKQVKAFTSEIFKAVDLGIDEIQVETENFEDWVSKHDVQDVPVDKLKQMQAGMVSQIKDSRNTLFFSVEKGVQKISRMMFEQFGKQGFSKAMDIEAQSDGTVRLLTIMPALYDAMKMGKTVLIDELDHSIHPHLVRELVRCFSSQSTNGQLLFTTHQTCLLNQEVIRTDEVWLIEKLEGSSRMYSLNDFKIHKTINIENGYLEGRYGSIPFIGDLHFDD